MRTRALSSVAYGADVASVGALVVMLLAMLHFPAG